MICYLVCEEQLSFWPLDEKELLRRKAAANADAYAEKLDSMADSLQEEIAYKSRAMTQNPTPRRMRDYRQRLHEAHDLERAQKALRALADCYRAGTVPDALLEVPITKASLLHLTRTRTEPGGYYDHIETDEYAYTSPEARAFQDLAGGLDEQARKERELARLMDKVRFARIPGYFRTPPEVVAKMVDEADLQAGQSILEPSAGDGAILDGVMDRIENGELSDDGPPIVACEVNYTLREILDTKGYELIERDFFDLDPSLTFDRILMNPPFENGQDIDHVRRAYEHLAFDGRLVSIMCEGVFGRSDKKSVAFRDWLSGCGWSKKLPDGSFKPSGTGVATRLVIIDKP